LSPLFIGVLILLLTALIFNNMTSNRSYPSHPKYHLIRKKLVHKIKKNVF
ncbi:MAG TPA: HPP family protein, partial [Flavobacterium sp.]|nr:HPP family protein [Flavobacterium sp.]